MITLRLFVMAAALLVNGAVSAAIDPVKFDAAKKAGDELMTLAAGSEVSGKVPPIADAKVSALLNAVFDRTAFGDSVLPIGDTKKLGELLGNAHRVGFVYMLAGTGFTSGPGYQENQKAVETADRNVATYASVIGRWYDYQMAIESAVADSTSAFVAKVPKSALANPDLIAALNEVRGGLVEHMKTILNVLSNETLDYEWRRERSAVLAELAPKAAKLISQADVVSLSASFLKLAESTQDPVLKARLKKIDASIQP